MACSSLVILVCFFATLLQGTVHGERLALAVETLLTDRSVY